METQSAFPETIADFDNENVEIYRSPLDGGISDVRSIIYIYNACQNKTFVKIEQTAI